MPVAGDRLMGVGNHWSGHDCFGYCIFAGKM